jgi:hypothetical protein
MENGRIPSGTGILIDSCQLMSFMSSYIIHVKSCHSCQIMSLISNHVIHVKSSHSCQIMSFMSWVPGLFQKFSKVGRDPRGVKHGLLSLRRQHSLSGQRQKAKSFPDLSCAVSLFLSLSLSVSLSFSLSVSVSLRKSCCQPDFKNTLKKRFVADVLGQKQEASHTCPI